MTIPVPHDHDNHDYEQDGILYCGNCNTPKQVVVQFPLFDGSGKTIDRTVPCLCTCAREQRDKVNAYMEREQKLFRLNALIKDGYKERDLRNIRFSDLDDKTEHMDKARKYVERFEDFRKDGIGLMMYGTVGNGKTWLAAAIANEIIARKLIPAAVISTATFMGLGFEEREWVINNHHRFPLLVLDDIGAERTSDYAMEQMFNLIDSRYKAEMPLIVTTNKLPSELDNPVVMSGREVDVDKTTRQKRIYDRVREVCLPLQFKGESRRKDLRTEKMAEAQKFFG